MAQLTPVALKYFTDLKIFSGKYIDTLLYIAISIVISYIVVKFIIQWLKNKNEYYTDVTTTTDPVISYETVIPTNSTLTKSNKTKALNIFSFVEPNKRPPGHYNESNVDLLVTNGLFTIGSNWLYDAVFAV